MSSPSDDEALAKTKQLTEMLPRGRKESHTQVVSRRSNSLAFEPRYWGSHLPTSPPPTFQLHAAEVFSTTEEPEEYTPSRPALAKTQSHGVSLSHIPNPSQHLRKGYTLNIPYFTYGPNATTKQRQVVRSLLPPDNSALQNTWKNRGSMRDEHGSRRRSKSTGSAIFNTAPIKSLPREPRVKITDLPTEVLNLIMQNLEQKDVHELLLASNKQLIEVVADYMYYRPWFASTYRFAQFVYTVSRKKHYALRVRHLDVSYFTEVPQLQRAPMAGWREWRYRSHDLYRSPTKLSVPPKKLRKANTTRRTHPPPNPFLESWALSRDIPLGGLCHCLQSCLNLLILNLSRVQLAEDHLVVDDDYPAVAWTGRIYVSDVPKSWTWKSDELRPVYNMWVVEQVVQLGELGEFRASNWVGLSTGMVRELMNRAGPTLTKVDFVGSGLEKEKAWAIKGSREQVRQIIAEMDEKDPSKAVQSAKSANSP